MRAEATTSTNEPLCSTKMAVVRNVSQQTYPPPPSGAFCQAVFTKICHTCPKGRAARARGIMPFAFKKRNRKHCGQRRFPPDVGARSPPGSLLQECFYLNHGASSAVCGALNPTPSTTTCVWVEHLLISTFIFSRPSTPSCAPRATNILSVASNDTPISRIK